MAEAGAYPEPARTFIRAGIERTADYQDVAYARDYLDRLKPIAEIDRKHGSGSGLLLAETARELALGMAYEDTVRVAELKIRPEPLRSACARRCSSPMGRSWRSPSSCIRACRRSPTRCRPASAAGCCDSGLPRRLLERFTKKGMVLKTTTVRGFLMLYVLAALKPTRRRSLRFQHEQAFLNDWLKTILDVAPDNYALAAEIAMTRTLVKGYSDTHERGRQRYDTLMQLLPRIMETARPGGGAGEAAQGRARRRHRRGAQRGHQGHPAAGPGGGVACSRGCGNGRTPSRATSTRSISPRATPECPGTPSSSPAASRPMRCRRST